MKSWVEKTIAAVGRRTEIPFAIRYADGTEARSRDAAPAFTLVFRNRRAYWRIAAFGHVGLLEAYFDGELDIEGSLSKALAAGMEGGFDGGDGPLLPRRTFSSPATNVGSAPGLVGYYAGPCGWHACCSPDRVSMGCI